MCRMSCGGGQRSKGNPKRAPVFPQPNTLTSRKKERKKERKEEEEKKERGKFAKEKVKKEEQEQEERRQEGKERWKRPRERKDPERSFLLLGLLSLSSPFWSSTLFTSLFFILFPHTHLPHPSLISWSLDLSWSLSLLIVKTVRYASTSNPSPRSRKKRRKKENRKFFSVFMVFRLAEGGGKWPHPRGFTMCHNQ